MMPRCHFDLRAFQGTDAALGDHNSLVSTGGTFQTDRVIVGLENPFAVIIGCSPECGPIDAILISFGDAHTALEAAGGEQFNRPLDRCR